MRIGTLGQMILANRDQRDAQPVAVELVRQAADFVIRDEFEVVEIVGQPAAAVNHDRDVPFLRVGLEFMGMAGQQSAASAHDAHGVFQGAVVDVAGAAELGIVGVANRGESFIEEI